MKFSQLKDGWCGPAALQYALDEQGIAVEQDGLAREMKCDAEGVDPDELAKCAEKHGCQTVTLEGKDLDKTLGLMEEYRKQGWSMIVDYLAGNSIRDGHYVNYRKKMTGGIQVFDPSSGGSIREISKDYLKNHWIDTTDQKEFILHFVLGVKCG